MTPEARRGLPGQWTTAAGWRLHARTWPARAGADSSPVVLVHGLAVSSAYMVRLGAQLSTQHRVLAPDLPGFGVSQKPPRGLGLQALTDVLGAWLAEMQLNQPVLLGNSAGCQIITLLAQQHPACAAGLVLVGPSVDRRHRTVWQQGWRLLLDATREPPPLLAIVLRDYLRASMRSILRAGEDVLPDRVEDRLPTLPMPAWVVRGSRDPLVPQPWAAEVAHRLPRGRLVVIPRAGHGVHYTHARAVAGVVRDFIAAEVMPAGATPAKPDSAQATALA
jgi:2-hydroxy-6-oxonona-2,4-dienedioate hydrolase